MSHLVSGPGRGSSSHHDNGIRFKQLVNDFIASCPDLAREYLQLEGIQATPEAVSRTAHQFLPQYIGQVARFLQTASPAVPQSARDEAFGAALTILLVNEHLGLAAKVIESRDLPISQRVLEEIKPLVEYSIISAIQSENLSEIIKLGSAIDPLFFHGEAYCAALSRAIFSYIEAGDLSKIVVLVDTPVQIPDAVIFKTRSEVEEAIVRHVREGRPLGEAYALSEMFLLSDFFRSPPFIGAVRSNIVESLKQRDLSAACRWAEECEDFSPIRRSVQSEAREAVAAAMGKFRYYREEDRSRDNNALLESLNLEIRRAVDTFGLAKAILNELPAPISERRVYRVGHPVCRLVHPPQQNREE